ncbi:MAG: sigma-54-dependent Fis family transcriptional regulator [Deltaproteobacteria bacterium]|nr:sigma-54-dependent Fis family transcriptional regulator [Deltaproteobacteria bacterium]
MKKKATILVVDDELGVRQSFNMVLKDVYNVLLSGTGEEAIEIFRKDSIDLILLDILLPDINGIDLLEKLLETDPNTEIIMVSALNDVQTAVKAIKRGAYEYIIKPFVVDDVLIVIERALEKRRLIREVTYLKNALERYDTFEEMVGKDKKMEEIFKLISTISQSGGTVLLQGESGTGKELVAKAIHNRSLRHKEPFVVINCATIPATLMESEIFGHNRGAFTGATSTNIGKLEIANKGTVFLDDIDSLDNSMQAKLLRIIQEKEFERLGSNKVLKADVRFIAASNKDLETLISMGEFREDLFYRLNVFPIKLPPLRQRRKDIPLLLNHSLKLHARKNGVPLKEISEDLLDVLMDYDWPGNVRELQNLVERLVTITKGPMIHLKDISAFSIDKKETRNLTLKEAVKIFEKEYIAEVLETVSGNRKMAAERLGVHRNTLLTKLNDKA